MDISIYGLLALPLFFGLGWLAARFDLKTLLSESRKLPEAYFKGLNFLLNERPDEALEVLAALPGDSQGGVELQFALGGLFRRRGEIDRATRLHQVLLNRDELTQADRLRALFELAQDYQKAGLFDRAEELFQKLIDTDYAVQALIFLKEIYLSEKEWERAIGVMDELIARRKEARDAVEKSHFLAECAEIARRAGKASEAMAVLARAQSACPNAVRPRLLAAEWMLADGRALEAAEAFVAIGVQSPEMMFLAAPGVLRAYEMAGSAAEGLKVLQSWVDRAPTSDLIGLLYQALLRLEGERSAYQWIRSVQIHHPSIAALDVYAKARTARQEGIDPDADVWAASQSVLSQYVQKDAVFICQSCGFKAKQFHWHCPACGCWDSMPVASAVVSKGGV